jgi:hypothetical protein
MLDDPALRTAMQPSMISHLFGAPARMFEPPSKKWIAASDAQADF